MHSDGEDDYEASRPRRRDWRSSVRANGESEEKRSLLSDIMPIACLGVVGSLVLLLGPCRPIAEPVFNYLTKPKSPVEKIINSKENQGQLDKNTVVGR